MNCVQEEFEFVKPKKKIVKKKVAKVKWTTESMRNALTGNTRKEIAWRWRAFKLLAKSTVAFSGKDGVGFNRNHESKMMRYWEHYCKDVELSMKAVHDIHKIVPYYSRQLARYANEKI